jgi:hypothetical protein
MAQSSKYLRLDEDVLLEFIYHDQSSPSDAEIENDNNGSKLKFLNSIAGDDTSNRFLVHELGADVVNFDVTISSDTIFINGFGLRELQLRNSKTYKFNLSDSSIDNPTGFLIDGATYNPSSKILTYTPSANGKFSYKYTNTAGLLHGIGTINVANKANSLYAVPLQDTGNSIRTGVNQGGRYLAVPSLLDNKFALVGNSLEYLDSDEWLGDNSTTFDTVIPDSTVGSVVYDTIRLHLRSGYNFNARGFEGFLFQVKSSKVGGGENAFTSIAYLNESNFENQNPNPFTMGDSMFSKYIEIKVPSLVHMFDSSINLDFQNEFFDVVSSGNELDSSSNYNVSFKLIGSITTENIDDGTGTSTQYSQRYINTVEETNTVVSSEDEFTDISVNVSEPSSFDYFEIFGTKNGSQSNFESYVNGRIQTSSDDISVFYEIEISEQVGLNYINTYKTTFVHTDNFDQAILFRPVILNSAISNNFLVRVTMRIYNETDNTQIVKVGSAIHNRPKKYGKQLEKINVEGLNNPVIYNKIQNTSVNNDLSNFVNSVRPEISETKYVIVAVDNYNVVAASNELIGNSAEGTPLGDATFKEPGECVVNINTAASSLVRFTLANLVDGDLRAIDLTGAENIKLVINNGSDNYEKSHDPSFVGIDNSSGEVMFKIDKLFANKFNGVGSEGTFYITLNHGSNNTSTLYNGKIKVV